MNKTQKGFAALETLLILVIIAIIGGIGWYAIHTKHQTDKILSQADKISQSTPIKTPKSQSTALPQKTLIIKEWNVQIPYSGSDTYSYNYDASHPDSIEIISAHLSKQYSCTDFGAGVLDRFQGSDPVNPFYGGSNETVAESASQNSGTYFKVGNYYFSLSSDNAACSSRVLDTAQEEAMNTFGTFVSNIQAIPQ